MHTKEVHRRVIHFAERLGMELPPLTNTPGPAGCDGENLLHSSETGWLGDSRHFKR